MARRLTTQEFIEKANLTHNSEYNYEHIEYKNSRTKVKIICKIHGEFKQLANAHLQGQGCPKCRYIKSGNANRSSTKEFISRSIRIHKNFYSYTKTIYTFAKEKVIIICPKHGEFKQAPLHHLNGHGCPKCRLKSQNKLYEKLKISLDYLNILWEYSPDWLGKQRFDIYIPEYNIAIEYNGRQHYIPVKHFGGELEYLNIVKRDNMKRKKCIDNNCILFELKYNYDRNDYLELVERIKHLKNESKN